MSQTAVDGYYDEISAHYDRKRFRTDYLRRVADREERFVVSCLSPLQDSILEVGPGTGRFTRHLAELTGKLEVCDISRKMLDTVRAALGERSDVAYHHLGIEALPSLPGYGRFDAAVGMRIVPHVPDWRGALGTFCNAVRPGGLLIFDLWSRHSFVGLTRFLLRRRSEVLTHRLARREILDTLAALPAEAEASYRWGYPRLGSFNLDQVGARLCPTWAYSTVTCCRRAGG